jgi:hypothetical protein
MAVRRAHTHLSVRPQTAPVCGTPRLPQFSPRSPTAAAFPRSTPHTAHHEHSARGCTQQKPLARHGSAATNAPPGAFNPHSSQASAGGLVHAIFCHRPRQPTSRRAAAWYAASAGKKSSALWRALHSDPKASFASSESGLSWVADGLQAQPASGDQRRVPSMPMTSVISTCESVNA